MWLGLDSLGVQAMWTAMIVQFVASMIGTTVAAVAPEITASIHFDTSFMGLYTACLYLGACLSSLVGGNFIIKYGPARIAEYGLLGCALSLLLCTADWSIIIIGSGLVLGLAKGPLMPANNTMVSHHTKKEHLNFVFSVKQTTGPLGIALGGVMTPYIAVNYDWRVALIWVAIIGLFGACWCLSVRKSQDTYTDPDEPINTKTVQESFRMVVGNSALLKLSIVSIFYQGLAMCIMAYLVTFLVHKQFSLQFSGLALSCMTIGILFGRLFWGWLADKIHSSKVVLALCGITMGIMTIVLAQVDNSFSIACVLAITFVLGFCSNGWAGVFFAQVAAHSPENKVSEATGGADFFMFIGAIFIPMLFGFLATYLNKNFHLPFYIIAASTIITGFLLFFLKGTKTTDANGARIPMQTKEKEEL